MKKYIIMIVVFVLLAICSCDLDVPNPIIGTFVLTAENEGLDKVSIAGFSFNTDGTFKYAEIVKGTPRIIHTDGTYTVVLDSFNFVDATGSIYLSVNDYKDAEGIEGMFLTPGNSSYFFDWECDRDKGPLVMTLVVDPEVPSRNLELTYNGGPDELGKIFGYGDNAASAFSNKDTKGNAI